MRVALVVTSVALALRVATAAGQSLHLLPQAPILDPTKYKVLDVGITGAYGGWVQYLHEVRGKYGHSRETATVGIIAGSAVCSGSQEDEDKTLPISGKGIFHLTVKTWGEIIGNMVPSSNPDSSYTDAQLKHFQDSLSKAHPLNDPAYAFYVACPNPGSSSPKEADGRDARESYDQYAGPRRSGPLGLPDTLRGSWSIPAPETDQLNGVTGAYWMTWFLCKQCVPAKGPP